MPKKRIKALILTAVLFFDALCCRADSGKLVCGAYIAGTGVDIAQYEEICGVKNSIYLIGVKKDYPKSRVMECYARGKIPMLLINRSMPLSRLPALADAAGEYGMPIYICIGGELRFYRYCAEIFRARCPCAVLVQPVMLSQPAYEFAGTDLADILAVTATFNDANRDPAALYHIIEQADIPVMINLAVCRYDENGHRYTTLDAIKTLNYVYAAKNDIGTRLFGINYINTAKDGRRYDIACDSKVRTVYGGLVCKWADPSYGLENR